MRDSVYLKFMITPCELSTVKRSIFSVCDIWRTLNFVCFFSPIRFYPFVAEFIIKKYSYLIVIPQLHVIVLEGEFETTNNYYE